MKKSSHLCIRFFGTIRLFGSLEYLSCEICNFGPSKYFGQVQTIIKISPVLWNLSLSCKCSRFLLFHLVSIKFSLHLWILSDTLKRLKEYKEVKVPIYNFVTHRREERMVPMYGANVIIFEGIFAFHDKKVVDLLDMKVGFCLDKEMCSGFFIVCNFVLQSALNFVNLKWQVVQHVD